MYYCNNGHHTFRNKSDLDSFIKTKTFKKAIKTCFIPDGIVPLFISLTISKSDVSINDTFSNNKLEQRVL